MSLKKWKNPFYTLLIPAGMVFVVTVFAYGFMAFMEVNATNPEVRAQSRHPLFQWLNEYGTEAVTWELAVLGVLTIGAIGTDHWWTADSKRSFKTDRVCDGDHSWNQDSSVAKAPSE